MEVSARGVHAAVVGRLYGTFDGERHIIPLTADTDGYRIDTALRIFFQAEDREGLESGIGGSAEGIFHEVGEAIHVRIATGTVLAVERILILPLGEGAGVQSLGEVHSRDRSIANGDAGADEVATIGVKRRGGSWERGGNDQIDTGFSVKAVGTGLVGSSRGECGHLVVVQDAILIDVIVEGQLDTWER